MSKARRMMVARGRSCEEAVGASAIERRMSCWRSVMRTLAVLPGIEKASRVCEAGESG